MFFNSIIAVAILTYTVSSAPTIMPRVTNSTSTATVPTKPVSTDAIQQLLLAPLAQDRFTTLNDNANFVFDFGAQSLKTAPGGFGGELAAANRKNFPALIGSGSGMAVGFLGGCGFNTPHVHPRATELQIVVDGTIVTEMVPENGVMDPKDPTKRRVIQNTLTKFQMTPFYQGSIHTQFNPSCEPATFIASFNSEDFGAGQVLDETFAFDEQVVSAAFGQAIDGNDVDKFKGKIPATIAKGVMDCLNKCPNIKRK
ncbi:Spherulin-1B [Lachnellula suecica]|uniref:Spherulin-1B n=1 Tax=Lachnellula suecica TaxID=602035 RepID=A0A8T9C6Z2_9HELO|nr:Spherulin-1B [Lachnellula suecica]